MKAKALSLVAVPIVLVVALFVSMIPGAFQNTHNAPLPAISWPANPNYAQQTVKPALVAAAASLDDKLPAGRTSWRNLLQGMAGWTISLSYNWCGVDVFLGGHHNTPISYPDGHSKKSTCSPRDFINALKEVVKAATAGGTASSMIKDFLQHAGPEIAHDLDFSDALTKMFVAEVNNLVH